MKASEEKEAEQGGARRSDRIGSKRVVRREKRRAIISKQKSRVERRDQYRTIILKRSE